MEFSHKILVLFAHPALEKSRVNRVLIENLQALPGITFHDLYEAYPDFHVDVRREQQLLTDHDFIVFQHPFFWYSAPALLKEWEDLVLEHGWAYGHEGTALQGKHMMSVITTGGLEAAYAPEGYNRFTMRQLLAPTEQTARLCGMEYLPPFVVHGTYSLDERQIRAHASDYRRFLEALRDGRVDLTAAHTASRINARLDDIIVPPRGS
jgi:glutathione-regulated potassium-efflux system ancillary protein KefG